MTLKIKSRRSTGFALVVTLSLMVLLTIIAVGLLTLSSVALRSSGSAEAMAGARSNARLALMLAIGELQKNAGPDRCVTARADILDENIANPRLTGVWNSWEIKPVPPPSASEFEKAARDAKFRGWLVSNPDPAAVEKVDFAATPFSSPVTLWGKGTLGSSVPDRDRVTARKIPLAKSQSNLAWAVMDEGLKVRINTPFIENADKPGAKTMQLGSGERPRVESITGLKDLQEGFFEQNSPQFDTMKKGISRLNFALAGETLVSGVSEVLKPLTHDVTTQSVGLFTDVARGGLKQDFQLLTNDATLPTAFRDQGVYANAFGMSSSDAPSDPSWNSFQQYARLYRDQISSSGGMPLLKTQAPSGWVAATVSGATTTINREPPPGVVLMPTIAKVQMLFSLIGRDLYDYPPPAGNTIPPNAPGIHGPQESFFRGTKYQYDLHLLYTPIVTLHNPYNVMIELRNVRLDFVHVPFAMQIFRNGIAQSTGLVPLDTMYAKNEQGQVGKNFGMNLKAKTNGKPGSSVLRLLPGEVKMFSPYIDPDRTYAIDLKDPKFWDVYMSKQLTSNIDAIPGWRGDGIGFDADWLLGDLRVSSDASAGRYQSALGLAKDDQIHVLFAPLGTPKSGNKFVIKMSAATATSFAQTTISSIEMDYEKASGLQDSILGPGGTLRYPKTGTITGINLVDHSTTKIKDIKNVKPFALLSCQAKSTSGGRDESKEDGRIATKPWCFAHANIGASTQKIVSGHSANASHEIDLQLLENGTSNLLPIDLQDRTVFISGHTNFNGTKFGGQYDIPLAPLQSLASLNGANPGGSSGYLPRFAQPIGNSWAHPLISTDKLLESGYGANYPDHSFLLNLALYDRYYFSGLANQGGLFGTGRTTTSLADDFMQGKSLDDPRLAFNRPDGKPASDFAEVAQNNSYESVASWQLMNGAFNINSTSVPAWKAMLASIHDSQAILNQIDKTNSITKLASLSPTGSDKSRISRFRLPAADSNSDPKDEYWLGTREYSDAQLQTLAENIVKQVRLRGPFLSMAGFVNRSLGSGDTAQRGALQQAIDDSNLNAAPALAANAGFDIPLATVANYKYKNPAAGAGPSYQGAPGFLSQADLLSVLGNAASARSDTFTIRGYGETRSPDGKTVIASATCEAVVQRLPDYLDPADQADVSPAKLTSTANRTFGRRFVITSFRWLNPSEI